MPTDKTYSSLADDTNKGAHFGSGNNPIKTLDLSTKDIPGEITKVVINSAGNTDTKATISVSVNDVPFNYGQAATTASISSSSSTDYEFTGQAFGEIRINWTVEKSAIYVKTITIYYKDLEAVTPVFTPTEVEAGAEGTFSVEPADFFEGVSDVAFTTFDDDIVGFDDDEYQYLTFSAGSGTVSVSWSDGPKYKGGTASFTFTVKEAEPTLSFSAPTAEVGLNDADDAAEYPTLTNSHPDLEVKWKTSDEDIAMVDEQDGKVSPIAEGWCTITAYIEATEGYNKYAEASYKLTVLGENSVKAPVFDPAGGEATVGDIIIVRAPGSKLIYGLGAAVDFGNCTEAEEDEDLIELNEPGTFTYWAIARKGDTDSEPAFATFTVGKKVPVFGFAESAFSATMGSEAQTLSNPEGLDYTLTSSDPAVALVSPVDGKTVWMIADGTATIIATSVETSTTASISSSYVLTVEKELGTVTEKYVTFTFDHDGAYGMVAQTGNSSTYNETKDNPSISFFSGEVTLKTNIGDGNGTRLWKLTDNTYEFRVNKNSLIEISVPSSSYLKEITFEKGSKLAYSSESGSITNNTWSCADKTTTTQSFKSSDRMDIKSIKVIYETPSYPTHCSAGLHFDQTEFETLTDDATLVDGAHVTGGADDAVIGYLVYDAEGNLYEDQYIEQTEDGLEVWVEERGDYTLMAYIAPNDKYYPAIATADLKVRNHICPASLYMHGHFWDRYFDLSKPVVMEQEGKKFFANNILLGGNRNHKDDALGYVFTTHCLGGADATSARRRASSHDSDWSQLKEGYVYHNGETKAAADVTEEGHITPFTVDEPGYYNLTVDFTDPENPAATAAYQGTVTGIEGIEAASAATVEWFSLQGLRVKAPAAGTYIRLEDGHATKVTIR